MGDRKGIVEKKKKVKKQKEKYNKLSMVETEERKKM